MRLVLALLLCAPAFGACGGSYVHCRQLTFDHTKAGGTDSATFVAEFAGTYSYLAVVGSGGLVQHTTTQTGGGSSITVPADMIFANSTCTVKVAGWEFESYNSATGALIAWVNVGTLTHSADLTSVYLCYGGASVTTWQGNVPATYTNYMLVQHLPDGTTLTAKDSAHANNGTIVGVTATAGQVDGAGSFPGGTGNQITVPDDVTLSSLGGLLTLSAWYNATGSVTSDDGAIIEKTTSLINGEYFMGPLGSFGSRFYCFLLDETTGGYIGRFGPQPSAGWHYMVGTYDGSGTSAGVKIYADGVQIDTTNFNSGTFSQMRNTTQDVLLGGRHSAIGGPFTATADEIRAGSFTSSIDRITAEFNNQSSPSTFYSVGSDLGGGGTIRRRLLL